MEVQTTTPGCLKPQHADQEPPSNDKCASGARPNAAVNACLDFDCSICLNFPAEPVVTLCGHLYCWPCIYKWLQPATAVPSCHRQCPVCKSALSLDALVPLYGRGLSAKGSSDSLDIPHRPRSMMGSAPVEDYTEESHDQYHRDDRYDDYVISSPPWPPPLATPSVFRSTAGGVLGGMGLAIMSRWFGNDEMAAAGGMYDYSNPYFLAAGGSSPRSRRRELVVRDSLHQLWVLLVCCALLCLLFF